MNYFDFVFFMILVQFILLPFQYHMNDQNNPHFYLILIKFVKVDIKM